MECELSQAWFGAQTHWFGVQKQAPTVVYCHLYGVPFVQQKYLSCDTTSASDFVATFRAKKSLCRAIPFKHTAFTIFLLSNDAFLERQSFWCHDNSLGPSISLRLDYRLSGEMNEKDLVTLKKNHRSEKASSF